MIFQAAKQQILDAQQQVQDAQQQQLQQARGQAGLPVDSELEPQLEPLDEQPLERSTR